MGVPEEKMLTLIPRRSSGVSPEYALGSEKLGKGDTKTVTTRERKERDLVLD